MEPDEDITSEEKLLNLIRKKSEAVQADAAGRPTPVPAPKAQSSAPVPGAGTDWAGTPSAGTSFLRISATLLWIVAVGLAVYIGLKFFVWKDSREVPAAERSLPDGGESDADNEVPAPEDFAKYEPVFRKRNIFTGPAPEPVVTAPAVQPQPVKAPPTDWSKKYKVVGILLDKKTPQAVIEDVQAKESIFVTVNDKLGPTVVTGIQKGRVQLRTPEGPVELRP